MCKFVGVEYVNLDRIRRMRLIGRIRRIRQIRGRAPPRPFFEGCKVRSLVSGVWSPYGRKTEEAEIYRTRSYRTRSRISGAMDKHLVKHGSTKSIFFALISHFSCIYAFFFVSVHAFSCASNHARTYIK